MHDLRTEPALADLPLEVDIRALAGRTTADPPPRACRRRPLGRIAMIAMAALLAGGGLWWHHTVTEDPGLEFYGGPNVYRDEASTDLTGVDRNENLLGTEVDIDFVRNGRLYAHFGLYNGGAHDVRIQAAPPGRYYYWGFDRMSLSTDPDEGFVGVASHYRPFRPFTLHRGQTVEVRLEYRLADCDPASLQPGGSSSVRSLPLRYRTFGVTRTADVSFRDSAIAVHAMGRCEHPI